jgi:hypothetical protein
MRWWSKALVAGIISTAGSIVVGYLIWRIFPEIGWEVPIIFVATLAGLAFLWGAFNRRVEPTIPPHFTNVQSHAEIHSMAFRKEFGNFGVSRWNPDMVIAAAPPLLTAAGIFVYAVLVA